LCVIDTHCHLTFPDFSKNLEAVLSEAHQAGVSGCITISTSTRDCLDALKLAKTHERVWSTAGVHPLYTDKGPHVWSNLRTCIAEPKCVAWGELGLDNHYPEPAREIQHAVLHEQLAFIERTHAELSIAKPIVVHCREAFDDLIPILRATKLDPSRFVFHCFTGTPTDMKKLLDFGAHVSFTGVVTYANAPEVGEAAKLVPIDRIMVETDAPYLSPEPVRKQRPCKPAMVAHTARHLASLRSMRFEDFHAQLNANTRKFFGIDAR
jgi:TatD DNase family protein